MKKAFSIVVTFNGKKWLNKCLGCLLDYSFPIKVSAVDYGSKDGTPKQIRDIFQKFI